MNKKWSDTLTYQQALLYCLWWFVVGVVVGLMVGT